MILAQEFACSPATAHAKSAMAFYCSAPTPPDVWAAIAAWASVLVTIIMAIFAWRAWRTSQKALEASREQLALTRDIELRKERGEALALFTERLLEASIVRNDDTSDEIEVQLNRLSSATARWASTYDGYLVYDHAIAVVTYLQGARYEAVKLGNPSLLEPETNLKRIDELASIANGNVHMVRLLLTDRALDLHNQKITPEVFASRCDDLFESLRDHRRI